MRRFSSLLIAAAVSLVPFSVAASPGTAEAAAEPVRTTADPLGELARTPPMGWNSWNRFGCDINESLIRQTADALVSSGMRDAGYTYVNIDDCWAAPERDPQTKRLLPHPERFPSGIAALADYVHAKGLKLGIYTSAGTQTCARSMPGALDHEEIDAQSFADWGVDYLKYDNCNNQGRPAVERYQAMSDALRKTGRPIVFALCEWGENKPWEGWGDQVGGHLWRTTGDISDSWSSMTGILDQQVGLVEYSHPNGWNDPDMLEVGNGGMTDTEYRAHFSLWALLNAPLLAGNDLRSMTDQTRQILLNRELIAVNQDWGGIQGYQARDDGDVEVWAKPMSDGSVAVVLFNRGTTTATVTTTTAEVGLSKRGPYRVRDLWTGQQAQSDGTLRAAVPAHGAVAYRVSVDRHGVLAPLTTLGLGLPNLAEVNKPVTVDTTLYNDGRTPLYQARMRIEPPKGWAVDGNGGAWTALVRPGQEWRVTWRLRPTADQSPGQLAIAATANFAGIGGPQSRSVSGSVQLVAPPPAGTTAVSALQFVTSSNGWGPVERDRSNGERDAGDGRPISIAGTGYATGLGVHATSSVLLYLGGGCSALHAEVGVDDEVGTAGSVAFQVRGDGRQLAESGIRTGGQPAVALDVPLTGVSQLELVVTDGGDGITSDHADWADTTVTC
ncbi:NPCBM/NEW2 domain-containing protein [Goodfellowiella coeruleoviolacea]|uniref:Alpha-galactosidase n=1 Tax=Goodfellowiella coeruleoviolacea TaxID=334858 RepID=A0AAE3KFX2_9PSEU|nr:NPCBM/NEW2 domain-containing protein [Goodfellowiella coeruleoviolacea]MCP2164869.1 alpha-galactosidase [Goodfellowiella coeruleoviolacea]